MTQLGITITFRKECAKTMKISTSARWDIKVNSGYGITHFGFNLPNGCLYGKRRVTIGKAKQIFRFVMTDFNEYADQNGQGGLYHVFLMINDSWRKCTVDIYNSALAEELRAFLTMYKGNTTSFHMPKKERESLRSPYHGWKEGAPSDQISAKTGGIYAPGRDTETKFAFQDHTDAACGMVQPYCWNSTFKNKPQVGYKRKGTVIKVVAVPKEDSKGNEKIEKEIAL